MDYPTSSNKYINLFYKELKKIFDYEPEINIDLEGLKSQVQSFEESSIHDETIILILNLKTYNTIYATKNISRIWKIEREEYLKRGFTSLSKVYIPEHMSFPYKVLEWYQKSTAHVSQADIKSLHKRYICGLKMEIQNKISSYLYSTVIASYDQLNNPIIAVIYINDISHLFKANFFWGRYIFGENNKHTFFYTTAEVSKVAYDDIISPREKEILLMIAENKDSKQIAKELNISVNTVEKHRKNMIARSGAKDSTALVQLCKMCNVV